MIKKVLSNYKKAILVSALAIFSSGLYAQSFAGSKALNSPKNISVDITTHTVGDSVNIVITGPSTVWHAVGFGGSSMNGTYCIVVDGQGNVTERKLGNHNGGSQLTSSISASSSSVVSGTRTTTIKRPLAGATSSHFTFPGNGSAVSVIWAYGSGATFNSHSGRGASLVTFTPLSNVSVVEHSLGESQLYPNPATNNVTVDFTTVVEGGTVMLKDMSGRVIRSESFEASQFLNLNLNEQAGLYILEIQSRSGESTSLKLMIK